jgi:uncharacterized protein (TIGR00661 family)
MRILYGVMGEGLGHAMRARVVTEALVARGHQVKIATSGRAAEVLRRHHGDVLEIEGLHLRYAEGRVARGATLTENLAQTPRRLSHNCGAPLQQAMAFEPNVVITDFESFAHAVGLLLGRPIISLDHQHVVTLCKHPRVIQRALPRDFVATKAFIGGKTAGCAHYIVSSFFFPELQRRTARRTTLVGPIVRPEVQHAQVSAGDHLLVYQTAHGDPDLLRALAACPDVRFVVYGARGETGAHGAGKNIEFKSFSEQGFVQALASARGVIANGGFTTLGEAAYLGKPVLSIPLRHQGEQQLNAAWVEWLGLGATAARPSAQAIDAFVRRIDRGHARPTPDARLLSGNEDVVGTLERVLQEVA